MTELYVTPLLVSSGFTQSHFQSEKRLPVHVICFRLRFVLLSGTEDKKFPAVNHRITLLQQNSHSNFYLDSGLDLLPKQKVSSFFTLLQKPDFEHSVVLSGWISG